MDINNIKDLIIKYSLSNNLKNKEEDDDTNLFLSIIASLLIASIPIATLIANKNVTWQLTLGTLSISAVAAYIGSFFYKRSNKFKIASDKINEELFDFLIENEKEIIKLMGKNLIEGDLNFADLKFNFIKKDYHKVMDCLGILINKSIEGKYSVEEQLKISQYDKDLKKEKEMNYSYTL